MQAGPPKRNTGSACQGAKSASKVCRTRLTFCSVLIPRIATRFADLASYRPFAMLTMHELHNVQTCQRTASASLGCSLTSFCMLKIPRESRRDSLKCFVLARALKTAYFCASTACEASDLVAAKCKQRDSHDVLLDPLPMHPAVQWRLACLAKLLQVFAQVPNSLPRSPFQDSCQRKKRTKPLPTSVLCLLVVES